MDKEVDYEKLLSNKIASSDNINKMTKYLLDNTDISREKLYRLYTNCFNTIEHSIDDILYNNEGNISQYTAYGELRHEYLKYLRKEYFKSNNN